MNKRYKRVLPLVLAGSGNEYGLQKRLAAKCLGWKPWLKNGDEFGFKSPKNGRQRAAQVRAFVRSLKTPKNSAGGLPAGAPFRLMKWQIKAINDIYSTSIAKGANKGKMKINKAILSMGRKNGKSSFLAALIVCHMFGPRSKLEAEHCIIATTIKVGKRVFDEVSRFVEMDKELFARAERREAPMEMKDIATGSKLMVLASDARSAHGNVLESVWMDELAQWKSLGLFHALESGLGAAVEPLIVIASTIAGEPNAEKVMVAEVEDAKTEIAAAKKRRVLPNVALCLYQPEADADVSKEETWLKGNPGLGEIQTLERFRKQMEQAERNPVAKATALKYYLNISIFTNSPLVDGGDWDKCQKSPRSLEEGECYVGLDLSQNQDGTAVAWYFPATGRLNVKVYLPVGRDKGALGAREQRDRAAGCYTAWVATGEMQAVETINYQQVAGDLVELARQHKVEAILADRFRFGTLRVALSGGDKEHQDLAPRLFGVSMSPAAQNLAVEGFIKKVMDTANNIVDVEKIDHGGSPMLKAALAQVIVKLDTNGNRNINKAHRRALTDPIMAAILACHGKDFLADLQSRQKQEKHYATGEPGLVIFT